MNKLTDYQKAKETVIKLDKVFKSTEVEVGNVGLFRKYLRELSVTQKYKTSLTEKDGNIVNILRIK